MHLSKDDGNLRSAFRDSTRALFKECNFKVFDEFDDASFDGRKFTVVGATNVDNCTPLSERLSAVGLNVFEIETAHYKGLYFEATPENIGIIIAPRKSFVSLDPKIYNQSRDSLLIYELQHFGRNNRLNNLTLLDLPTSLSLVRGDDLVVSETLGDSCYKLFAIKYENSHQEYIRYFMEYKNTGKSFSYDVEGYNNSLEVFSWIYQWEIKILAERLQDQRVTIHDVGTSAAQFPLMLIALTQQDLYGLNVEQVIASDMGWTGEVYIKLIKRKKPEYKPISFLKLNLITQIASAPATDVVVANDVLEHLPNDQTALEVLKALWNKTNQLLIAHVPIEPEPNPSWDHYISLSGEKIREWAGELPGARFLSDDYFEKEQSLSELGYLIVAK